jgi:hypothetical protein
MDVWIDHKYPEPEITTADNHPVYVNGTKLVNGHPIIDDKHKDSSRVEEFKTLRFSPYYVSWLTGENWIGCSKGKPSVYHAASKPVTNNKIGNETVLCAPQPLPGETVIKALIEDNSVVLDIAGIRYPVTSAPAAMTKPKKVKFLKAVVRTFLDDPENVLQYVNRTPAPIPVQTAIEPVPVELPDYIGAYTQEAITGYPLIDIPVPTTAEDNDTFDQLLENGMFRNREYNGTPISGSNVDMAASMEMDQNETDQEIIAAFNPVCAKPAGYISYLNLVIREVALT